VRKLALLAVFLLAVSCTTAPCKTCPPEDVYLLVEPGVPVSIPKGFFDNPGNYWTEDEFREMLKDAEMNI